MSKYLDEFKVGERYTTQARTITETDVIMFASMTGDQNDIHTNALAMAESQFGERLAHGLLGLSMSHGLFFRLDLIATTAIAFLEIENWKFLAPIRFGDTINCDIEIADVIPSRSKPDRGVVKFQFSINNLTTGLVCQSGIKSIMVKRNPAN